MSRAPRLKRQYAKVCDLADFSDHELAALIPEIDPDRSADRPHRKAWEWALGALFLRDAGMLDGRSAVLDVGAGREPFLFWLAARVGRVVAVDTYGRGAFAEGEAARGFIDKPADFAPYRYPEERLEVLDMDARSLDFADGSFDAVVSFSSVEHFGVRREIGVAMSEIGRVLRPGGVAFVVTEGFVRRNRFTDAARERVLRARMIAERWRNHQSNLDVFTARELRSVVVAPSGLCLLQPIEFGVSESTWHNVIRLDGGTSRSGGDPYPHVMVRMVATFTSVALPLWKP